MENRYGVDVEYFKKELAALSRSLPNRTPDELDRYLRRLADVAKPPKSKERRKTVRRKAPAQQPQHKIADKIDRWLIARSNSDFSPKDFSFCKDISRQLRAVR